jgi:hypothetical protein
MGVAVRVSVAVGTLVFVGNGVALGGIGVAVRVKVAVGRLVFVGKGVALGGMGVLVFVEVGGTGVAVGADVGRSICGVSVAVFGGSGVGVRLG